MSMFLKELSTSLLCSLSLQLLLPFRLPFVADAHSGGLHGRQGYDPPNAPELPEITGGPFEVVVKVRFDDINAGLWQRVFDFGNGDGPDDNIFLSQYQGSTKMEFRMYGACGTLRLFSDYGAIEEGVEATWRVGLDSSGVFYMYKDGKLQRRTTTTCVPRNVIRTGKLLGKSHWSIDEPLHGAVLGIRVRNLPGKVSLGDIEYQNIPRQLFGSSDFTASMHVRFDTLDGNAAHPNGSQHVFDFAESSVAPTSRRIYFAQVGNTTDMVFGMMSESGALHEVIAPNAIVLDEFAFWHVELDDDFMSITKNGIQWVKQYQSPGLGNTRYYRKLMLTGASSDPLNRPLDGVVLSFRID